MFLMPEQPQTFKSDIISTPIIGEALRLLSTSEIFEISRASKIIYVTEFYKGTSFILYSAFSELLGYFLYDTPENERIVTPTTWCTDCHRRHHCLRNGKSELFLDEVVGYNNKLTCNANCRINSKLSGVTFDTNCTLARWEWKSNPEITHLELLRSAKDATRKNCWWHGTIWS